MNVVTRAVAPLVRLLPEGRLLPEEVWRRRHSLIVGVAFAQAVGLLVLALAVGLPLHHAVAEALLVALPAVPARSARLSRKARSASVTASLMTASAVLVHLLGGVTEAHFHFFVMIGLVSLYQDWVPFGVGLGIVLAHHGLIGTTHPQDVYGTPQAQAHPWLWAGVHGGFVLAASLANLAAWRLNEQQGLRDPLSGLANRTLFTESTTRRLSGAQAEVSVLFVDLDDFKSINDSRGHAAGDTVLLAVADRLSGCVRSGDVVARLGGDEFALLLPGPPDNAHRVGERVLRALADPISVEGRQVFVRASVGLASTRTPAERDAEVLLRNADLAMYTAKAGGKARLAVYADGMAQTAHDRAQLTADLAAALARGELHVHYQPSVTLSDGRITGVEALARWRHPARGLVPPAEFVPLAEEAGLINALGEHVLRTATAQAAAWADAGTPVDIAVNLSPHQVASDGIVDLVRDALTRAGLPPQRLTLEVTEGVLVHDVDAVAGRLAQLRALGARIAIDDFGTGYSSLSYLRQLPVDTIKIDRSFVTDLPDGGANAILVSSMVELARSLGLDVVAEGVETESQAQALKRLSCGHAQGYLYARPQPADDVTALLDTSLSAGPKAVGAQ
ncbi:MAG: EAL domain-containing protein [Actinomycetota bacterium]|nr:EAL domain-containing protein [Actinomycetota bacterium]